jgi:hypothetical protein
MGPRTASATAPVAVRDLVAAMMAAATDDLPRLRHNPRAIARRCTSVHHGRRARALIDRRRRTRSSPTLASA